MSKSYSEKLRDPRWQKARLKILERDEWTCQFCFDSESTLSVHHKWYIPSREPWEYPELALITLCEDCHAKEMEDRLDAEQCLIEGSRVPDIDAKTVDTLGRDLHTLVLTHTPGVVFDVLHEFMTQPRFQALVIELCFEMLKARREEAESEADHA